MPVRDKKIGKATPLLASEPANNNPADYDVPENFWQQQFDSEGKWSATADVKLNEEGEANIPLQLIDDNVVEGKETIKWKISDSDPFGFKEKTYTFSEGNNEVNILLSDNKDYRKNKTVTIFIEDNDLLTGGASVGTLDNDPLTGDAGAGTSVINSPSEGIDTITDFTRQEDDKPLVLESGFGGGLTEGNLLAEQFTIGSAAANTSEPFIYDSSTGGSVF